MKYFSFLPFIGAFTFNKKKLTPILYKLWVDASLNMDNWIEAEYDRNWKIGLKNWGSTVISYIYLKNMRREPTTKELETVILALPQKFKYRRAEFAPQDFGEGYSMGATLSSDI